MNNKQTQKPTRNTERVFLLLATAVLALLFYILYGVLQQDFREVPARVAAGSIVNLNAPDAGGRLRKMLRQGFYFEDDRDIQLISSVVDARLRQDGQPIENIGELNKRTYFVDAPEAFAKGGASFQKRVQLSRELLGFSGRDSLRYASETTQPEPLPARQNLQMGAGVMNIRVQNQDKKPRAGVLVRLSLVLPQDSLYSNAVVEIDSRPTKTGFGVERKYIHAPGGQQQLQELAAYARTDGAGEAGFSGLPQGRAYAVQALQPGFQFGSEQGVSDLQQPTGFTFIQQPHAIRLLSSKDFNILKKEGALIVRMPEEVNRWFWIIAVVLLTSFWVLHLFLSFRLPQTDQLVLPVVLLLSGFSFLMLISLQDPLRDRFLARDMLVYFGAGMVTIALLQLFDLRKFTPDSGLFRLFYFKNKPGAEQGWPWVLVAAILLIMTLLMGTGPEGSGVKVNLFGFQPSEFVRFLLLLFLAGFFTANETFIAGYATARSRWRFFNTALLLVGVIILLFLMLGDLGPAMVVCFTFIILLSFARGDFAQTIGAVFLYTVSVWLSGSVGIGTGITAAVLALYFVAIRKQISEPAIMAVVVIAAFLLLDQVPFLDRLFPGPLQRLTDRKAIWENAWDNNVFGGDQVANGIWAMASGGIRGQGIGAGFGKTIPEAHTDMILPALGEEFGWAGIISIFMLFLLLLHRALVIGRQTGRPFLFYLAGGIGISTFVQFVLIAGGSTGALPLSGVALPFVSYGGSSLLLNMLAAGFLLSVSVVKGTPVQLQFLGKTQDRNLMPALVAASAGVLLLGVNISKYLFNNQQWVVEPALVAERGGARMFSYNPRIAILMNRLQAGNIYDRNNFLLATSTPGLVARQTDSLAALGLEAHVLEALSHRRQDRYYPFGAHAFFWTGDANTGVFSGGNNGYFAEYQLGPELRGFPTPVSHLQVVASRYREDRFLPRQEREMVVARKDYRALSNLLLAGINSPLVDSFKQQNRDVQLTVDAGLQTALQQSLQNDALLHNSRVSVVVMDSHNGDVLASALYPLPPVTDWDLLTLPARQQAQLKTWVTTSDLGLTHATQPGSTAKLLTALAAFNKLGDAAARRSFVIRPEDLVRTRGDEPDETGTIGLERAIVKSNNPYFIRLANEAQLQEEMATLYIQTGMFLRGLGGYYYSFDGGNAYQAAQWRNTWRNTEFRSSERYNPKNIRATRGLGISGMAWGQGELVSTPASVARLAAAIANRGLLVDNRYLLRLGDSAMGINKGMLLARNPAHAQLLTGYMQEQSAPKKARLGISVAGKTGTPERIVRGRRINDGWYVFFAPAPSGNGHLVCCIRVEDTQGSSVAVDVAGRHVIPLLRSKGYIQGF